MEPGTNPSAYVISAVIGNSGAQKCQRQHLRQGRNALRVKQGTNAEQYGAGDKKANAEACFQKSDGWHHEQRVLLVLVYPCQEYIADDTIYTCPCGLSENMIVQINDLVKIITGMTASTATADIMATHRIMLISIGMTGYTVSTAG